MPKKRLSPTFYDKNERKEKIADEDFEAQLKDLWHLLEKKERLNRKELFISGSI